VVDEGRVARLLRGVEERLDRLDDAGGRLAGASPDALPDALLLDAVKYLFVTAIEGCVDVGHHVAASERWGAPDTNAAAFTVLAEHGVIDTQLAARLGQAVGFRNVLVHQYAVVDDQRVMAYLEELGDLRAFVQQVSRWMTR